MSLNLRFMSSGNFEYAFIMPSMFFLGSNVPINRKKLFELTLHCICWLTPFNTTAVLQFTSGKYFIRSFCVDLDTHNILSALFIDLSKKSFSLQYDLKDIVFLYFNHTTS